MLRFGAINMCAAIALTGLLICNLFYDVPWWPYFILALIWSTLTIIGSFHIRWNYHINSLNTLRNCTKNEVALTFDDGPHPEFTPQVLGLLRKYNAKATFFCIGKHADIHRELLCDLIAEGHTVGNHTFTHANRFGFFGTSKVVAELVKTNNLLEEITGKQTKLYRPAFGVTNPNIKKALKITGLTSVGWSIRSLDTTRRPEEQILKRITENIAKGDVVLLHDTSDKTVAVLERLLLFLKEQNLRSVTVDQLFNIKAYA